MPGPEDLYSRIGEPPKDPGRYHFLGIPLNPGQASRHDVDMDTWLKMRDAELEKMKHNYTVGQAQALLPPGLAERLATPDQMKSTTTQEPSLVPHYAPSPMSPPSAPRMRQGTAYGPGAPTELQGPGAPIPRFTPTEMSMMAQAGGGVEAAQPLLSAYSEMKREGARPTVEGPRPSGMTPMAQSDMPRLYGPTPSTPGQITGQFADTTTSPTNNLGPGSPFSLQEQPGAPQNITRQELDPNSPVNAAMRDRLTSELHRQSLRAGNPLDPEYQNLRKENIRSQIEDRAGRGSVRERRANREDDRLAMQQSLAQARINHMQGVDKRAADMAKAGRSPADIQMMKLEETRQFHRAQVAALLRNDAIPDDQKEQMISDLLTFESGVQMEPFKEPAMTIPGTDFSLGTKKGYRPVEQGQPTQSQATPIESKGKELSAEQAAQDREAVAGATRPTPRQGEVIGGYRYKGGDPNKKESWEKAE